MITADVVDGDLERVFAIFSRLKERISQKAGTLSGGEQQMLAVGRALMSGRKVMLLDEPSMGLAPLLMKSVFDALKEINQEGTTILLVEQNARMAFQFAQRGYVLENGNLVLEGKSQELDIDIPDELPPVLGNPVRLRQMMNNLISNGIKFAPEGGHITIRVRAEGNQIITQIIDDGPGIPATDQPYIFDKFYRASNVHPDSPGTGLGLAIVKSIVENHMGRIWVESVLGDGTTFTVVLPTTDRDL